VKKHPEVRVVKASDVAKHGTLSPRKLFKKMDAKPAKVVKLPVEVKVVKKAPPAPWADGKPPKGVVLMSEHACPYCGTARDTDTFCDAECKEMERRRQNGLPMVDENDLTEEDVAAIQAEDEAEENEDE
jgi:hypothetical protein